MNTYTLISILISRNFDSQYDVYAHVRRFSLLKLFSIYISTWGRTWLIKSYSPFLPLWAHFTFYSLTTQTPDHKVPRMSEPPSRHYRYRFSLDLLICQIYPRLNIYEYMRYGLSLTGIFLYLIINCGLRSM